MSAPRATFAEILRRLCAVGGIALVFALTVFAASPALHEHLHHSTETAHDESCPIVLFAAGAALPLDPITAPLPPVAVRAPAPVSPIEIFVSSPRALHPPGRGPPVSR